MLDVKKYIVLVENPSVRDELSKYCVSVGKGHSLTNYIIVESSRPAETLLNIPGVIDVEEEVDDEATSDIDLLDSEHWHGRWGSQIKLRDNIKTWVLGTISGKHGKNKYYYPRTGRGVDIYVLDSGIMDDHEDLKGKVTTLFSVDGRPYNTERKGYRHGTMCASIAAGHTYGVAEGAHVFNLAYNWKSTEAIKALDVALKHHLEKPTENNSILNMSFSTTSNMMHSAIRELHNNGFICVAAAGNDNRDMIAKPAVWSECISVGCITEDLKPAHYTNYHESIDIMAPGHHGVAATIGWPGQSDHLKDLTGKTSGTSAAAPLVAGIIAIMLEGSERIRDGKQLPRVKEWLDKYSCNVVIVDGQDGQYKDTPRKMVSLVKLPNEVFYHTKQPEPPIDNNPPIDKKKESTKNKNHFIEKVIIGILSAGIIYLLTKGG
jgi:subtilisin family serine protease